MNERHKQMSTHIPRRGEPLLSRSWDAKRNGITYKVEIVGTNKFLLLSEDLLLDLQAQINDSLKSRGVVA
jgi:hypothetical protein